MVLFAAVLTGARFFLAFAGAFTATFFVAAFLRAIFFGAVFAASAFFSAHRGLGAWTRKVPSVSWPSWHTHPTVRSRRHG